MAAVALTWLSRRAVARVDRLDCASRGRRAHRQRRARRLVPWLTRRLAPPPLWVVARLLRVAHRVLVLSDVVRVRRRDVAIAAALWIVATPTLRHPRSPSTAARDVSRCRARETPRSCSFRTDERSASTPAGWHRRHFDIGGAGHLAGALGARRSAARLHERHARRRRPHRRCGERVSGFQAV